MSNASTIPNDVVDEAIGWMVASREGLTGDEQAELDQWLAADTRHRLAWQRLEGSFNPFRVIEAQPVRGQQIVAALARQRVSRRAMIGNGTMALAALATTAGVADRISPLRGVLADYSTSTAQRRRFALPDGGNLALDARSEASQAFGNGRRGIVLHGGMAFVNAPPRPEPFTVGTGDMLASFTGGSLVVSNRQGECRVICMAGKADLRLADGQTAAIAARGGVVIAQGRIRDLPPEETRDAASWLDGQLILHDRRFGELIDAFRPYRAGILSISDAAARLRVSGVFDLDRPGDVLAMVPELYPVRILQVGSLFARIDLVQPRA